MSRPVRRRLGATCWCTVMVAMVLLAWWRRGSTNAWRTSASSAHWGRWVQAKGDLAAARDELLFLLATRRLTPLGFAGTPLLRVDGRPYRLPSGVWVSVQDLRGLISIVAADPGVMTRFLVAQGVPERDAAPLLDKLADYNDLDNLRRLNGAEADAYAAAGLPPPRNDWPISPYELSLVLGWREHPTLWGRASDHFTDGARWLAEPEHCATRGCWRPCPGPRLRRCEGCSTFANKAFTSARRPRCGPHRHPAARRSGGVLSWRFYRLRLWRPEDARAVEYTVMLAPDAPISPWLILETRQVRRPTHDDDKLDPPLLAVAAAVTTAASAATP